MWNRRRSNAWMAVELLFVFCLTWYLVDFLFVLGYNYSIPNYRDTNHTWQVNLGIFSEGHPEYDAGAAQPETLEANFDRVLRTIRNFPGVEDVAISYNGSAPGSGNYFGANLRSVEDTTQVVYGQRVPIDPAYDFFRVFGASTGKGKHPASVKDFDWAIPNAVVIGRSAAQKLFPGGSAVGKEVESFRWSDDRYVVIGVVDDTKRFDYLRPQNTIYFANRLNAGNIPNAGISVRSNASLADIPFRDAFMKEMLSSLRVGNFYLKSVVPYTRIEQNTARAFGLDNEVKTRTYLMAFFLLNILLCVMGTFWYRINQRRDEIGLRKAVGATRNSILGILLMEGVWLLLLVTLPAMLIEYQFVHAGLIDTLGNADPKSIVYLPDRTSLRFLITNGITWLLLAATILAAIWLPAQRASAMQPADALHHE